ncbi:hypothetical protein JY96_18575 [Aquabacterium sp. NJ1]|uniref:hypothetical protein n=1 Tax=Aquabacterium sp. NJ1 TaxID=1538295 RepID=UPI00052B6B6B|nr:hypothetical protein [Aquabacterium sp. NJ1]KGM41392.1 hypothetical protein JY96_18575 [Aquabacterium sp. NJ1]
MKMDARLSFLLALGILAGCASNPPPDKPSSRERCYSHGEIRTCTDYPAPSHQQVADLKGLRPPPAGVSRLVLVRNDWRDAYGQAQLVLDGADLPRLIPCSVVGADVPPGEHQLHVSHVAVAEPPLRLVLKSQEVTVVNVKRIPRGAGSRGFSLQPLERAEALALIQECAVVGFADQTVRKVPAR